MEPRLKTRVDCLKYELFDTSKARHTFDWEHLNPESASQILIWKPRDKGAQHFVGWRYRWRKFSVISYPETEVAKYSWETV